MTMKKLCRPSRAAVPMNPRWLSCGSMLKQDKNPSVEREGGHSVPPLLEEDGTNRA